MSEKLGITRTPARVSFKSNAGQNNHFLITVLVGLDSVHSGNAVLMDDFSTSWSPKNVQQSALRSRQYALVASLAWITDLVDVYRKRLLTMTSVFDVTFAGKVNIIDGRANRLSAVVSALEVQDDDPNLLLTLFAIRWRNTIVHSDASTRLDNSLRKKLLKKSEILREAHRGLDVERSVLSFEHGGAPTFKEVASFIAAAQKLVQLCDTAAIAKMDLDQYAESTLSRYFSDLHVNNAQVFSQYWPNDPVKTSQRLKNVLKQLGFTEIGISSNISLDFFDSITHLTAKKAGSRLLRKR